MILKIHPDTYEAGGRPEGFNLDGQKFVVKEVIDHWYEAGYEYLQLLADDERMYLIKRREGGSWELKGIFPY